jgi:hypothetical protein
VHLDTAAVPGLEEGVKDRPCAIVMMAANEAGKTIVTVLPVTHSPPADVAHAVEIPRETKERLGLDGERSWVVIGEADQFAWPGPDLRPAPGGDASSSSCGLLPRGFFRKVRDCFDAAIVAQSAHVVARME